MLLNRMVVWLRALRLPFLTASLIPVALGSSFAYKQGFFDLLTFLIAISGMCIIHLGCNLCNDYFDHKNRTDWLNRTPTPFSGGSRVIQDGLIPPTYILLLSFILFFIGSLLGLYLCLRCGWELILIGIPGVFLAFFYSAPPFWIAGSGLGEASVGIGFGILPVVGSYFVQTRKLDSIEVLLLSIPISLLIAAVVYINEFPDYQADKQVGKNTIIVRLGQQKATSIYFLMLILTYFFILSLLFLKILPIYGIIVFFTIPLALRTMIILKENYNNVQGLLKGNAGTIQLHFLIGILMCFSLILDRITRT